MALRLYDKALLNKIEEWVKDPNMTITGPDETDRLFNYIADITKDGPIKLPLISLRRGRDIELQSTNKKPLTFDGATTSANKQKSIQLNAIPITIPYQLDIYTRYFAECDEYIRNFTFNLINFPQLTITIPYNNINLDYEATVVMEPTISDNSDIPERLIPGQFTRFTINLEIINAYLFSVPIRDNVFIDDIKDIDIKLKDIQDN